MSKNTVVQEQKPLPVKRIIAGWQWQHAAVKPFSEPEFVADKDIARGSKAGSSEHWLDFSQVKSQATSCPTMPTRCPFGGACHTCPTQARAKLAINQPGDEYEQEADRMAERVTQAAGAQLQRRAACREGPAIAPPIVDEVLRYSGQPLDPAACAFMELRFGHDFGDVRVHTDAKAAESAQAVNALAYTVGRDVVFGVGQYAPRTEVGKQLVAHELTHVVQQRVSSALQRNVTSEYPLIKSNLSYGLFDWAITDAEAREALNILLTLSDQDLIDTYFKMETDGIWGRFESNLPNDSRGIYDNLRGRIERLTTITNFSPSDQHLIRDVCLYFFPGNPPGCVNSQVASVALEMVVRAVRRCGDLMDIIPRPPANPGIFWLLRQVGAIRWRQIAREGRAYVACRNFVAAYFRSIYEDAKISCETETIRGVGRSR